MKARRVLAWGLCAAGCFGLGVAASRWAGWSSGSGATQAPMLPPGVPAPTGTEPLIYIDAGAVELYDGSLTIHPPPPPRIEQR